MRLLRLISFLLLLLLVIPAVALASTATNAPTLILPWQQIWPIVIGAIVPLVTYVLNRVGPWISQPVKAAVLIVTSAAATALYTALATNVIGLNDATLQLVLTGVASSLAAHHLLWKPAGVSTALGAYALPHSTPKSMPPGPLPPMVSTSAAQAPPAGRV